MRVLVVEDEQRLLHFLKSTLEADFFAVDIADDGAVGARLATENDYDLIILDNQLPNKEGLQICREIREQGKKMPIIIVSVKSDAVNKINLLNAGADDYLTKPFVLEELMARVRALLRRSPALTGDVFTVGDLVLNTLSGKAILAGTEIYLTRKEFMLLQYLMQNQGVVLSRGMILEHVWDMNVDIFSNTVESHILSLRKKIGDTNSENKLIRTIPGRGYKIEA